MSSPEGQGAAPRVHREGDVVLRPAERWTPAVALLLQHLEQRGAAEAPRHLGYDPGGRQIVSFLDGAAGADGWAPAVPRRGLEAMARLLRRLHDASVGFRLPEPLTWADRSAPREAEVVCHGDFGPWNLAWRDGLPVGAFDWDMAHAGARMDDVAYAVGYTAPFVADDFAVRWLRFPGPPDRQARMRSFWTAYWGAPPTHDDLQRLVERVLAAQERTRDVALRLAEEGVEPQATWVREGRETTWQGMIAWTREHGARLLEP